jgi:hypothetical protein
MERDVGMSGLTSNTRRVVGVRGQESAGVEMERTAKILEKSIE